MAPPADRYLCWSLTPKERLAQTPQTQFILCQAASLKNCLEVAEREEGEHKVGNLAVEMTMSRPHQRMQSVCQDPATRVSRVAGDS